MLWGRSVLLAAVALATGATSHLAAGGLMPPPVILAVTFGGLLLAAPRLLRSQASLVRAVLLVVGGQAVVHAVLSATGGHAGTAGEGHGASASEAHVGSGLHLLTHLLHEQADHLFEQGPLMLLAHTLGAALVGAWLWVGETAVWNLVVLRAVRPWLAVRLREAWAAALALSLRVSSTRLRVGSPEPPRVPLTLPFWTVVGRRGPPELLCT